MPHPLKTLVRDYSWVHLSLGIFGNTAFLAGSVLFLPALKDFKTLGVWLFIVGALFMWIGALGRLLVSVWEEED